MPVRTLFLLNSCFGSPVFSVNKSKNPEAEHRDEHRKVAMKRPDSMKSCAVPMEFVVGPPVLENSNVKGETHRNILVSYLFLREDYHNCQQDDAALH